MPVNVRVIPPLAGKSTFSNKALHAHLVKVNDTFFDVTGDVRETLYGSLRARILP